MKGVSMKSAEQEKKEAEQELVPLLKGFRGTSKPEEKFDSFQLAHDVIRNIVLGEKKRITSPWPVL